MIASPTPMTDSISIPTAGAALLCRFIERLDNIALRRLLDRASTGELLWGHAQHCPMCRRLFMEMPAEVGLGSALQLYFLETGVEGGDRLFEHGACRFGVALRFEAFTGRLLRLVRDVAPPAEDRRPAEIRLLRIDHRGDGETLYGEIPDAVEEIMLEERLFRRCGDHGFSRVLPCGLLGAQ
jgi:hypothetical protein